MTNIDYTAWDASPEGQAANAKVQAGIDAINADPTSGVNLRRAHSANLLAATLEQVAAERTEADRFINSGDGGL